MRGKYPSTWEAPTFNFNTPPLTQLAQDPTQLAQPPYEDIKKDTKEKKLFCFVFGFKLFSLVSGLGSPYSGEDLNTCFLLFLLT